MSAMKDRLNAVLDHLETVGDRDKGTEKRASDCAVWAIARAYDRDNSTGPELIGRDVDRDLLAMMREAYTAGRDPQPVPVPA